AVDPVHAVGVQVVGEPTAAADARDEHGLVRLDPELGKEPLDRGQNRVVAAPRAPPNLLVGGEVLLCQRGQAATLCRVPVVHVTRSAHSSSILRISRSRSSAKIGTPCTFVKLFASTRYLPRISSDSWPRFISGIRTFR